MTWTLVLQIMLLMIVAAECITLVLKGWRK